MIKHGFDVEYSCDILDMDPSEEICEECFEEMIPTLNNKHYSEYDEFGIDTRTGENFNRPITE